MKVSSLLARTALVGGPAVLLSCLLAWAPAGDKVSFHPESGLSLKRTFSSKQEITLDENSMTINGQPSPMQMEMDMTMGMAQTLKVTDVFEEVKDGRALKLVRTFDAITSNGDFSLESPMIPEPQNKKIEAKSELEGKTVKFVWDAEKKEHVKTFAKDEGDEKLLQGLREDMDLVGLLPEGEKAEGDTWDVELEALKSFLMPGGQLGLKPEKDEKDPSMAGMDDMGDLSQILDDLEGKATAEYKGTTESDGVKCGKILVKFTIKSAKDMSDKVREAMSKSPVGGMQPEVDHMDVELEMEGEGELLWNLAGGYAHSFEMSAKIKNTTDMGFKISAQGKDMDIVNNMAMSGTYTLKLENAKN